MAAGATKVQVLAVYKALLRESGKLTAYNFRSYALRRTRDAFKSNKQLQDASKISKEYEKAMENLKMMKRQSVISEMYSIDKLVIEMPQI